MTVSVILNICRLWLLSGYWTVPIPTSEDGDTMHPKCFKRASKFKYILYAKVSRPGKPDSWHQLQEYKKVTGAKMILNMGDNKK